MHVFELWEEAVVPGKNPQIHAENMQTPYRKTPPLTFEAGTYL